MPEQKYLGTQSFDDQAPAYVRGDPLRMLRWRKQMGALIDAEGVKEQQADTAGINAHKLKISAQQGLSLLSPVVEQRAWEQTGKVPSLDSWIQDIQLGGEFDVTGIFKGLYQKSGKREKVRMRGGFTEWETAWKEFVRTAPLSPAMRKAFLDKSPEAIKEFKRLGASVGRNKDIPQGGLADYDPSDHLADAGFNVTPMSLGEKINRFTSGQGLADALYGTLTNTITEAPGNINTSRKIVMDAGPDETEAMANESNFGTYMRAAGDVGPSKLAYHLSGDERLESEKTAGERAGAFVGDMAFWMMTGNIGSSASNAAARAGAKLTQNVGKTALVGSQKGALTSAVGGFLEKQAVSKGTGLGAIRKGLTAIAIEEYPSEFPNIYTRANAIQRENPDLSRAQAILQSSGETAEAFGKLAVGAFKAGTPIDERLQGIALTLGLVASGMEVKEGAKYIRNSKNVHAMFPELKGNEELTSEVMAKAARSVRSLKALADSDPAKADDLITQYKEVFQIAADKTLPATERAKAIEMARMKLLGYDARVGDQYFPEGSDKEGADAYINTDTKTVFGREDTTTYGINEENRHKVEDIIGLTGEELESKFIPEDRTVLQQAAYSSAIDTLKGMSKSPDKIKAHAETVSADGEYIQWLMDLYFVDKASLRGGKWKYAKEEFLKRFGVKPKSDSAISRLADYLEDAHIDSYLLSQIGPGELLGAAGERGTEIGQHKDLKKSLYLNATPRDYAHAVKSLKEGGGFTVDSDGVAVGADNLWDVAGLGKPLVLNPDEVTPAILQKYVDENPELFSEAGVHLGGYTMEGSAVIEPSKRVPFEDAVRIGTVKKEQSIYFKRTKTLVFLDTEKGRRGAKAAGVPVYSWKVKTWLDPKTKKAVPPPADIENIMKASQGNLFEGEKASTRFPSDDVRKSEESYRSRANIPGRPWSGYTQVDETSARAMADYAHSAPHAPNDPAVIATYKAMVPELMAQADQMMNVDGVKVEPWLQDGQPYANSEEMRADVRDNKHLYFFLTDQGFGSGEFNPKDNGGHPLLEDAGIELDGHKLVYNDVLRFVHDYYTHAKEGYEFGARGEENAFLAHASMFTPPARMALAIETKAQNNWVNYGPHLRREDGSIPKVGDEDFVAQKDRPYLDQKVFPIPEELYDPARLYPAWKEQTERLSTRPDLDDAKLDAKFGDSKENFLNWFKGSVAVKDGMPLPLYHGSARGGFTTFNTPTFASDKFIVAASYPQTNNTIDFPDLPKSPEDVPRWMNTSEGKEMFPEDRRYFYYLDELDNVVRDRFYTSFDEAVSDLDDFRKRNPDADATEKSIRMGYGSYSGEVWEHDELSGLFDYIHADLGGDMDSEGGVYEIYMRLENPYIVEGNGNKWDDVYGHEYEVADIEDELYHFDFSAVSPHADWDITGEDWNQLNEEERRSALITALSKGLGSVSTDDIVNDVKSGAYGEGYDGIIFRNIVDAASDMGLKESDVYVVFDPNQIKSATNNNGKYSDHDPNILKSTRLNSADDNAANIALSMPMNVPVIGYDQAGYGVKTTPSGRKVKVKGGVMHSAHSGAAIAVNSKENFTAIVNRAAQSNGFVAIASMSRGNARGGLQFTHFMTEELRGALENGTVSMEDVRSSMKALKARSGKMAVTFDHKGIDIEEILTPEDFLEQVTKLSQSMSDDKLYLGRNQFWDMLAFGKKPLSWVPGKETLDAYSMEYEADPHDILALVQVDFGALAIDEERTTKGRTYYKPVRAEDIGAEVHEGYEWVIPGKLIETYMPPIKPSQYGHGSTEERLMTWATKRHRLEANLSPTTRASHATAELPKELHSTRLYRNPAHGDTEGRQPFYSKLRHILAQGGVSNTFVDLEGAEVVVRPASPEKTVTDKQGNKIVIPAREALVKKVPGMTAAEQFLASMKNSGIKDEELRMLGFEEFLQERADKGRLSVADIVEFVDAMEPDVLEARYYFSKYNPTMYKDYRALGGGKYYFELMFQSTVSDKIASQPAAHFGSPFYGVYGNNNRSNQNFAHLRGDWHKDLFSKGDNVLMIQELQSDASQAYDTRRRNRKEVESLADQIRQAQEKLDEYGDSPYGKANPQLGKAFSILFQRMRLGSEDTSKLDNTPPAFRNVWVQFGLRRAIEEAVQGGATHVAWPVGDLQEQLYAEDTGDEDFDFDDNEFVGVQWDTSEGRVTDAYDLRLINADAGDLLDKARDLGGVAGALDVFNQLLDAAKTGDTVDIMLPAKKEKSGHQTHYDIVMPEAAQSYVKKWGSKVQRSTSNQQIFKDGVPRELAPLAEVWMFEVTESMKQDVLNNGQPLYSTRFNGDVPRRYYLRRALSDWLGLPAKASVPRNIPKTSGVVPPGAGSPPPQAPKATGAPTQGVAPEGVIEVPDPPMPTRGDNPQQATMTGGTGINQTVADVNVMDETFEFKNKTYRGWDQAQQIARDRYKLGGTADVLEQAVVHGRPLSDTEHAEVMTMRADLEATMANTLDEISHAEQAGDFEKAQQLTSLFDDQMTRYSEVAMNHVDTRSEAGRALAAGRMLSSMFSGTVDRALQAAKTLSTKRLTKSQIATVTKMAGEVSNAKKASSDTAASRFKKAQSDLTQASKDFNGRKVSFADLEKC